MTRNPLTEARPTYDAPPGRLTLEQRTIALAYANAWGITVEALLAEYGHRQPVEPVDPVEDYEQRQARLDAAWDALDVAEADRPHPSGTARSAREAVSEVTRRIRALNLPREGKERRRERHIKQKAERLGISYADAEAVTQRRTR